jgi:hypothetical protein
MSTSFRRIQRLNISAGVLHLTSGILVVALSNGFALPIDARYMAGQPGSNLYQRVTLGHISMAWLIAAFFFLSALAHLVVGGPRKTSYEAQLKTKRNPYRWLEYSLSSSLMIVAIAQLTGIADIAALIALIGVNASMIGFGWLQERYEQPGGSLQPFWLGCLAGVVPWIAIGFYLFSPGANVHAPGFVYGIYVSLFLFFNCFAAVQLLQYKKIGRFSNYLTGEVTYIVLSFVAKSLLAWQIFFPTLMPAGTN